VKGRKYEGDGRRETEDRRTVS